MELKDYTIEELQAEIKRRKKEQKKDNPQALRQYAYAKGTVVKIYGRNYADWKYYVEIDEEYLTLMSDSAKRHFKHSDIQLHRKSFSKKTAPKVGDKVLIQSRISKDNPTGWGCWFSPCIVKVLEE